MRARIIAGGSITAMLLWAIVAGAAAQDEGRTIRVAQDGSGDVDTVEAAIEAASDGDTILIAPGDYQRSLYIDKDLTLRGNGPRDEIVLALEVGGSPLYDFDDYMHDRGPAPVYVDGANVIIEGLTIRGRGEEWPSLWLKGGSADIRDLVTDEFIAVRDGASFTIEESDFGEIGLAEVPSFLIRDNEFRGLFASAGSVGSIEDNVIRDHPVYLDSGAEVTLRGNIIDNPEGSGVEVLEPGTVGRILDNDITAGWVGVLVEFPRSAHIEGNTIDGGDVGVVVLESDVALRDNAISAEREVGVYVMGDGVTIEGNTIHGGRMGMHLEPQWDGLPDDVTNLGPPTHIEGNTIEGASHFGIVIEGAEPSITGNTICAGREPLRFVGESDPTLGTNDICEVAEARDADGTPGA